MPQPRWNAAIFGRLVIPAAQRKAWLAADLDWKSVENNAVLKGYISGESVRDMVDDVNFVEATEFLDITWTGDELRLGSFQSRDGFNESMVGFAAAWAASAAFEGTGELYGLGMGARFGYRVSVANGKTIVVKFGDEDLEEIAKLEQHPDAVALRERMAGMGAAMVAKLEEAAKPIPAPIKPAVRPESVVAAVAPESKPAAKKKAAKKASGKT
jgi:hypothetical protein